MKIISWNLNGLQSSIDDGLISFIDEDDADIYVFQETKVGNKIKFNTKEKYFDFWSFNKENHGYSGTLCLTKKAPIKASFSIEGNNSLDLEGRIITLEFEDFFLINCYFPNSQNSSERKEYRYKWDILIYEYLNNLKKKKSVIVCGDFNVSYLSIDVHEESKFFNRDDKDFEIIEKENFKRLLNSGFIDAFREKHKDIKNKYSWWSNKDSKRQDNKGYRLDYFLVSEDLKEKIIESNILSDVYGSDHCPIILEMDINNIDANKKPLSPYLYDEILEYQKIGGNLDEFKEYDLTEVWDSIDFDKLKSNLKEMQKKLALFAIKKDFKNIKMMQDEIVSSLDAKVLAVSHVAENIKTPGVDRKMFDTNHEKMIEALSLTSILYSSKPNILYNINCRNNKMRHIQIPTCHDRAMQCLYAYALDPISEAWGEKKSFSYRKGKSSYDLDYYIKKGLSKKGAPTWLLIGDVSKYYEHINHDWILNNIPLNKEILYQFIKSGYIFEGDLYSNLSEGVGIGCTISPIIANMTLDGLSRYVYKRLYTEKGKDIDYEGAEMIRYADDILFMARTKESAEEIEGYVIRFLHERGVELSVSKTKIINIEEENFEFGGREYYKENDEVFSKPSKKTIEKFKNSIFDLVYNYKGSQRSLIEKINKKIDGFASYHKVDEASAVFKELDDYIRIVLFEMCTKKYKSMSKKTILKKYWFKDGKGRDCYSLLNRKEIRVKCLTDTILISYKPVLLNKNPYIDYEYFESRSHEREMHNVIGNYRKIWNRQGGRCFYCGEKILKDEGKTIIEFNPTGKSFVSKNAYVHKKCIDAPFEIIDADEEPSSINDVNEIFERMKNFENECEEKYEKLKDFFKEKALKPFSMTFHEIEKIIEEKFGNEVNEEKYWYKVHKGSISHAWLDNGFEIEKIIYGRCSKIFFKVIDESNHKVYAFIPTRLMTARLTADASYELNNFLDYFMDKNGI